MSKASIQIESFPSYINRPLPTIDSEDSDDNSVETNNGFNENSRYSIRSMPPEYTTVFPVSSIEQKNKLKQKNVLIRSKSLFPAKTRALFKARKAKLNQIETVSQTVQKQENQISQVNPFEQTNFVEETLNENPLVEESRYSEEPPICYHDLYLSCNNSTNIQIATNQSTPQNRRSKLSKQLKSLAKKSFYIRYLILVIGLSFFSIFTQIILSNF
jgi:hypothetical protein